MSLDPSRTPSKRLEDDTSMSSGGGNANVIHTTVDGSTDLDSNYALFGNRLIFAIGIQFEIFTVQEVIEFINDALESTGKQFDPELVRQNRIYDPITGLKLDFSTDSSGLRIPVPKTLDVYFGGDKVEFKGIPVPNSEYHTTDGNPTTYQRILFALVFYSTAVVFSPKLISLIWSKFILPFAKGTGTRNYRSKVLESIEHNNLQLTDIGEDILTILDKVGGFMNVTDQDLRIIRKLKLFLRET